MSESEVGGKKEPLFVEGVDINSISQAELLRHVQKMLTELVSERAERQRAQAEADLARTAWSSVEEELEVARCRLFWLRLEADRVRAQTPEDHYVILPETGPRRKRLEASVKEMAARLPAAFDKRSELKYFRPEEGAVDAGKEVVSAVDRHLAFAEEQLMKITIGKKWSRVRERHLRTFCQVQQAEVEADKSTLIHELAIVHEESSNKIQDFFKRIIQQDLFLMLCLKDRIATLKNIKEQRKQALQEDQKGLLALKNDMKALLNQIVKGFRKAKMYESNKNWLHQYDILIRNKEKEAEELCQKKKCLEAKAAITEEKKAKYVEVLERMKRERDEMLGKFKEVDVFKGLDEFFCELMRLVELEAEAARVNPVTLATLKEAAGAERQAVQLLQGKVHSMGRATAELISAVERRLQECGITTQTRFRGLPITD